MPNLNPSMRSLFCSRNMISLGPISGGGRALGPSRQVTGPLLAAAWVQRLAASDTGAAPQPTAPAAFDLRWLA